jgi:hypothetical protein
MSHFDLINYPVKRQQLIGDHTRNGHDRIIGATLFAQQSHRRYQLEKIEVSNLLSVGSVTFSLISDIDDALQIEFRITTLMAMPHMRSKT